MILLLFFFFLCFGVILIGGRLLDRERLLEKGVEYNFNRVGWGGGGRLLDKRRLFESRRLLDPLR